VSRCKACGQEILWCISTKGNMMPVDPRPEPDGNLRLIRRGSQPPIAEVKKGPDLLDASDDGTRYYAHHMTCPNWKVKKKAASG